MDMHEYHDDGFWEASQPYHSSIDTRTGVVDYLLAGWWSDRRRARGRPPDRSRTDRHVPQAPRPRIWGWSIVVTAAANLVLLLMISVVGASLLSVVSLGALALSCWILVVAEVLSLRQFYSPTDNSEDDDGDRPGAWAGRP